MMRSTATSLAVWSPQMGGRVGKGLDTKGLAIRDLVKRGMKRRDPIDRGDTETSLTTMSLNTTFMT
jgi:hypothetical protein